MKSQRILLISAALILILSGLISSGVGDSTGNF